METKGNAFKRGNWKHLFMQNVRVGTSDLPKKELKGDVLSGMKVAVCPSPHETNALTSLAEKTKEQQAVYFHPGTGIISSTVPDSHINKVNLQNK